MIDLSEGFPETSFNDVRGELLGTELWLREGVGVASAGTPKGVLLKSCQVHFQIIKGELSKLHHVTDSALER